MATATPGARRAHRHRPRFTGLTLGVVATVCAMGPCVSVRMVEAAPADASSPVQVLKDSYSPPTITVHAGATVVWTNADTTAGNGHTVTSSGRGPLKSQSMAQGDTFSYTFATAGKYPYYCAIHPDMTGTVIVS